MGCLPSELVFPHSIEFRASLHNAPGRANAGFIIIITILIIIVQYEDFAAGSIGNFPSSMLTSQDALQE
jgi:hypothetical protein